ncbi:hypothetical protein PARHAE_02490 [Paracoccus haematequi]|uniref:Uncharacterized protein n=1 Tax=Paracoccus haematequi TaxID=2491866 RepID=A0A447IP37_9RHOB|nr:hypothetical protein PARHAE_02490 [Paracoccus haematequi]
MLRPFASGGSGVAGSTSCTIGSGSGVVEPGRERIGGGRGVRQRDLGLRAGPGHGILKSLPGSKRPGRGIGQHARGLAIGIGSGTRIIRHGAETEIGRGDVGSGKRGRKRVCRCRTSRRCRALEGVVDPAQVDRIERADPHPAFTCRPFGQQGQRGVQRLDKAVDAGDDTVQHRLDPADQPVRGLVGEIADGARQAAPDRHRAVIGALEDRDSAVPKPHDARDGAVERRKRGGLQPLPSGRHAGQRCVEREPDARPDLGGQIGEQPEGFADPAHTGNELGQLIDQLADADDQRTDAGADQRPAQDDERSCESTHRQRGGSQPGDPAAREEGREGHGIGGQAADIVEETANGDTKRAGAAGDGGHGVGDRFQRGGCGDGELVRQPAPDQPEARDRVVRALDLVSVLFGNDDAEGEDVLGRLAQRRGVDARHGDGAFLAEKLSCDGRAFCSGHEVLDGGVDRADALVQRQRDQVVGRKTQPVERVGRGTAPGGRLAETAGQVLGGLLDPGHGHARQLARALQRLDRGDGGSQRLRKLRLRIDGLEARLDHRHASSGGSCHGRCGGHTRPPRKGREPGVRRFHLPA